MTKRFAALLVISSLLLLLPAFAFAQTAAIPLRANQLNGQDDSGQLATLKKEADALNLVVDALPQNQPEKEGYQKRIAAITTVLQQILVNEDEVKQLQANIEAAEKTSSELTQQIEELKNTKPEEQNLAKLDLVDLKTRKAEVEVDIKDLQSKQQTLQDAVSSPQSQKEQLGKQLLDVDQELESLGQAIASQLAPTSLAEKIASLEVNTRQLQLDQQRTFITFRQQQLDVSIQFDLNEKRLERVTLQLANQERIAKDIDKKVADVREQEAKELATQATNAAKETQDKFPQLASSEAINVTLAENIRVLEAEAATATKDDRLLRQRYLDIFKKFNKTVKTIKQIRQSNTIGSMLRKRKAELPTAQSREQRAATARDRVEEIQANKFQDSEDLSELSILTIREEVKESLPDLSDEELDQLFMLAEQPDEPEEQAAEKNGQTAEADEADGQTTKTGQTPGKKDGKLVQPARQLVERRIELLHSRDKIYDRLFNSYVDIETNNSRVADIVEHFNDFINERILWLRSSKMLFSELKIDKADQSLLSADKWQEINEPASKAFQKRPLITCVGAFALFVLLIFRPRMRKEVDALGQTAARGSCATFWPTGRAMVLTTLIAVTVPLIVYGLGWVFKQSTPSPSRLFDSIATGLSTAGLFAIPIEILRRTCRPDGLAVKHFNWPGNSVAKLKFHLGWYVIPASIIVFAVALLDVLDPAHRIDLIERVLFIIGILLTAWLFYRVLSPKDGIFSNYLKRNENSWVNQTKVIWVSAVVLIPITLAVLAFTGYYYTALNLTHCLSLTFAFAVVVEMARAMIRRLVTVRQRAAFIESAKRKRKAEIEAAKEARKQAAAERQRRIEAGEELDDTATPVVPVEALAEMQFDFSEIKVNADHANQLIRLLGLTAWFFGLWIVWGDVLPAMKVLDEYKLWGTQTEVVASPESSSESPSVSAMTGMPVPESDTATKEPAKADSETTDANFAASSPAAVTTSASLKSLDAPDKPGVSVRDLLVAIAIVLLTFVAARNLPNAFEMLFLEDLPFDRSARSASKALFSYGIVIFGAAFAMRTLSINWTNVQWLVTALTFGLAFGLQEIFANFVAGIILMFERPMRLGDLITVDDFTGFVTRIRTRATTVVNWDRKEYVIPNKDFITGRLINWTLSDAINRVEFTVGVAYGSDVAKAKKLIFEICKSHPSIVEDPPTTITFEEFADSTLNLVVRTYLNEVLSRLPVLDSLHMQINDKFKEAEIEIAFPQQDFHFKSVDEDLAKILANIKPNKSGSGGA